MTKAQTSQKRILRPPIVTVLGHVNHGKCVSSDTLIPLSDGRILTAKDLYKKLSELGKIEKKDGGWIVLVDKGPKVFSFTGDSVKTSSISTGWKLPVGKRLFRIELASGDKVVTTPEHPFFLFSSNGQILEKRTDQLKEGDFVLVPKNLRFTSALSKVKRAIFENLKKSQNWVLFLRPKEAQKLLNKMKKFGYENLLKERLLTTRFDKLAQKKLRLRAQDFFSLISYFNFSFQQAYSMVGHIKNSTTKWRAGHTSPKIRLPQTRDDFIKLGYILGCLIGDGYIPDGVLDNNDPEVQGAYSSYIEDVFETRTRIKQGHTCQRVFAAGGKTFVRFLTDIVGLPPFKKSATVSIPPLVQKYQPMVKSAIEGWLDTDGYVSPINHCVEFTSKSPSLVKQVAFYLLNYGVHSTVFQKKDFWYLRIANKPYLKLFARNFRPKVRSKAERIKSALSKSSTSRIFDITPIKGELVKDIRYSNEEFPYFDRYKEYSRLSRPFIRRLLGLGLIQGSKDFRAVINTQVSPVKVRKISELEPKEKWVYDFSVDETHNFVAERVFVHNTTLLDKIRKTNVVSGEAGGITQGIGASVVETSEGKKITFIDTPGHEAFSKMRARGAKVADLAILVVAADDGVKPQTKEALSYIKDAKIPFIVVVNKVDLASADVRKVRSQLEKEKVAFEKGGGDTPLVSVSAKKGVGIEELLETITLVSEVHEVKGDPEGELEGVVIETGKDRRGKIATCIVRNGTLRIRDEIISEGVECKVKGLFDDKGRSRKQVPPGGAALILGFSELPPVGGKVRLKDSSESAKVKKGKVKVPTKVKKGEIPLVIKAESAGLLEAVLANLPNRVAVIGTGVGDVNKSEVFLAKSAQPSFIFALGSRVSASVSKLAETEGVTIETFDVIYEFLKRLEELLEKGEEKILGKAEILDEFPYDNRRVAGCTVLQGRIAKSDNIVLMRDDEKLGEAKIASMRKEKQNIDKAQMNDEFGIIFTPQLDFKVGDVILSVKK